MSETNHIPAGRARIALQAAAKDPLYLLENVPGWALDIVGVCPLAGSFSSGFENVAFHHRPFRGLGPVTANAIWIYLVFSFLREQAIFYRGICPNLPF